MNCTAHAAARGACHAVRAVLLAVVATVLCAAGAWAQSTGRGTPPPVPYSGVITTEGREPFVGQATILFALYDSPTAGVSRWVELQTVRTSGVGRYRVMLGSVTAFPRNLFASGRPLWLGIQIASQPQQPRVRFSTETPLEDERTEAGSEPPPTGDQALRVFLDCARCDDDYLRQRITFLNHVVDREDAQVHVLVTSQSAGGGTEFTFAFIGLEAFTGRDDEVRYLSSSTDTEDEEREGIAQTLQLGLLPYLAGTPLAAQLEIFHDQALELGAAQPEDDPWNFWVFEASADAKLSGQASETDHALSGSFSGSRTTEAWRIRFGTSSDYSRSDFDLGDGTNFVSTFRNFAATGLVIKSGGDHWGFGVGGSAISSSFLNQDLTLRVAPAIEYNVFPYSESTRRQLTISYAVGVTAFDYEETTIFNKNTEVLWDQALRLSFDTTQPWGESGIAVEASHFLNDPAKSRVTGFGNLNFRITRGLSVFVWGDVSRIRDQVFLSGADLSVEDRLVRRRRLATDYEYSTGFGISIQFGSIFNNVVNSRFAGSTGGIIRKF